MQLTRKQETVAKWFEGYRDAYEGGKISIRKLSQSLLTEHPEHFDNYDTTRFYLRAILGLVKTERAWQITVKHPTLTASESIKIGMPKSQNVIKTPLQLVPKNFKSELRIGIIGDVHLPFHDEVATEAALRYLQKHAIDVLILNGDILDCAELSEHEKTLDTPDTVSEIEAGREFLRYVRSIFPTQRIIYKLGNHEIRWRRRLMKNAPELAKLLDMEGRFFMFGQFLRLDELEIELEDRSIPIMIHDLNVIHGHELQGNGGVNVGRWLHLNAGASTITNHFHRIHSHKEGDIAGNKFRYYGVGCLCGLSPDYRPMAHKTWGHGFALVRVEGEQWTVWNKEIEGGVVLE
jgi:predicted phosphodiesterase